MPKMLKDFSSQCVSPEHTRSVFGFAGGEEGRASHALTVPRQLGAVPDQMRIEVGEFGDTPCLFPLPELEKSYRSLSFTPFQNFMASQALDMPLTPLKKNSHGLLSVDLLQGARQHAAEVALAATEKHEEERCELLEIEDDEQDPSAEAKKVEEQIIDKEYIVDFHNRYGHAPPWTIAKVFYHLRNPKTSSSML